jgi:hypothetical protein
VRLATDLVPIYVLASLKDQDCPAVRARRIHKVEPRETLSTSTKATDNDVAVPFQNDLRRRRARSNRRNRATTTLRLNLNLRWRTKRPWICGAQAGVRRARVRVVWIKARMHS